jgi:hypothetical protein
VKTLDRLGLNVDGGRVVTLLRASLWSSDFSQTYVISLVVSLGSSYTFLFILICCVRGSPHHLVSILLLCGFIYKTGCFEDRYKL